MILPTRVDAKRECVRIQHQSFSRIASREFLTISILSCQLGGIMKQRTLVFGSRWVFGSTCLVAFLTAWTAPGHAQPTDVGPTSSPPFTATLSNNIPLAFGMDEITAAHALGGSLNYIEGPPGDEVFLALRNYSASGFFNQKHRLYLQFRRGRLVGWKGDWGHNWMWR